MTKSKYTLVGKFNSYGKNMVTVIIKGKAACVMSEEEYNILINNEKKAQRRKDRG